MGTRTQGKTIFCRGGENIRYRYDTLVKAGNQTGGKHMKKKVTLLAGQDLTIITPGIYLQIKTLWPIRFAL